MHVNPWIFDIPDFVWGGSCVLLLPDESIEQLDLLLKMVSYVSSASLIECESATKFTIDVLWTATLYTLAHRGYNVAIAC